MRPTHLTSWMIRITLILLLSGPLCAEEPIELLNAGTMQKVTKESSGQKAEGESSYIFFDRDVHLKQGDVHLFADRAYQYPDLDLLRLEGDVRIFDDSVTVWFEKGEYNTGNKDIAISTPLRIRYDTRHFSAGSLRGNFEEDVYFARGDVTVRDSMSHAYADSLLFDRENERAFLYGRAFMADTVNNITIRGSELEYRLDEDRFYGHRDASVYESREDGGKRFEVFAGQILGDMEAGWLTARDSVYVQQDSAAAWCDSLYYLDSLQTVDFYGSVRLQYRHIDMYASHISLDFHRDHLGALVSRSQPRVTLRESGYPGDTSGVRIEKYSEMTGKYLYLTFDRNDDPERMDMAGMVLSDYHVFRDSVYKGLNHMSSDTVRIFFEEGEVRDLYAVFGVRGEFRPDSSYAEMDTTVTYQSEEAHYDLQKDMMYIYPQSRMTYGDIKLASDTLEIDWETNILYALPGGSGRLPEFIQGDDAPVYGRLFEYNLDTDRGKITRGKTQIKEGYYQGRSVMKTEEEPLYVSHGVFSTCELEEPHFCLEAERMKVIPGDRVFAQDIVFKVLDVPLLYVPSLFVPIEEGERRSGWILPHFGRYANKGWALEGSGYYWAPNDYYDARVLLDFYDNYGINTEIRQRYAWRDRISNGHLTLKYWNYFLTREPSQGYRISVNHPQQIGRNSRLHISGSYTNDARHFTEELDKDERLQQQIVSRASFRTSLGPFSLNLNASRTEDLLTGNSTTYLPQFSLSRSSANIFKRKSLSDPKKWYHNFTYSFNSSLTNRLTHTFDRADSLFNDDMKNKFQTNVGVRYNDKLFGFLTVSPELNYSEDWTTIYKRPVMRGDSALVDSTGALVLEEARGFKRRGTFDMGARASTTLYGVFNINIWRLKAMRHSVNMSMNYIYRPDLSGDPAYVFRGIGTDGETQRYDYFESTLLGKTPSSQDRTFDLRFNHNFEIKTLNGDNKEKKTHILNLRHHIDLLADSLHSSTFRASSTIRDLPGGMSLKLDATFDPYDYRVNADGSSITRIDRLTLPRLTEFKAGTDLVLGPKNTGNKGSGGTAADSAATGSGGRVMPPAGADPGFTDWKVSAGLWFTSSAINPLNVRNRLLVNTNIRAKLTPKWSGSYQINIDVLEQKITDQRIRLTRDLHCWTLSLDWNPGYSFFISLRAKADLLKSLKLEKRSGRNY